MSRLEIPAESEPPLIWSASMNVQNFLTVKKYEPPPTIYAPPFPSPPPSQGYVAVNLDPQFCTGVSFFMRHRKIVHVHAHGPNSLPASAFYEHFHSIHECNVVWIYMPLVAEDKITAFGVRNIPIAFDPSFILVSYRNMRCWFKWETNICICQVLEEIWDLLHRRRIGNSGRS